MESPTRFSTIKWFQNDTDMDSKENSILHPAKNIVACIGARTLILWTSIWSILEAKVSAISQGQIRAACDAFVGRFKAVVRNKGGYIE